jgi:hypothetical protein
MRHEQIAASGSYNKIDIAAVWPVAPQVAPVPVPDAVEPEGRAPFAPTPSAPDVPAGVGVMIVASFVSLLAAFAFATVGSAHSIFMITISALFLVAFFTVPRIFLKIEPKSGARPTLERFMAEGMETLTGHSSGRAALIQILIVPVLLTFGALAMGIAASFIF